MLDWMQMEPFIGGEAVYEWSASFTGQRKEQIFFWNGKLRA